MKRRYEKYKESDIKWVGEIPSDWQISKIKFVTNNEDGKREPISGEFRYDKRGDYPYYGATGIVDYINDYKYDGKYLLIGEDGAPFFTPNKNVAFIAEGKFWVNNHAHVLSQKSEIDIDFLCYMLNCVDYKEYISGSTRDKLTKTDLSDIRIILPQIEVQNQIVLYLNHQTAIIDQIIQQKEKLIELLKEKRQAVINEAVTKGLNPNAKMKYSGIEWLGEVPEHWEVTKMKFMATITRGAILRPVDNPDYFDDNGEWTYLNISDATKCDKYLYEGKLRLSELGSTKSARVLPNNLILTASATIGKPFINKIPVCVHDGFIPITNIKCSIDYLYHYLRNPQLYVALGKVNTQKNIYLDEVKDLFVTQPPINEQNDIVLFLESFEITNNELILKVENQIEKLKEYRQSIISEAVTGKIDVRDWQPK